MKEKPILFSMPMVQAILEGRKTQTRRVIKPQPKVINKDDFEWKDWCYSGSREIGDGTFVKQCPYGQPGDWLWVREKWRFEEAFDFDGDDFPAAYWYYASTPLKVKCVPDEICDRDDWKWKPSIHMPKAAARIWLEIEEVKVERLQDITREDAISEGMKNENIPFSPIIRFFNLWEHINGKESLHANPWVWVVKFKILSTTGNPSFDSAQDDKFLTDKH